jgi:hypothetical protein
LLEVGILVGMRRLSIASALLLSACATRPPQAEVLSLPAAPQQAPRVQSGMIGLTASELVRQLGRPYMQIREGTSIKLQFRHQSCVLDAYLYPTGNGSGPLRVAHIDTRAPSGVDYNQAACVSALENSG